MQLPELPFKIPEIPLPFDIPLLAHPAVVHFIIALPIIVLLLEIVNLIVKKRALGVTSFFLLLLTILAAAVAYMTGAVDGKEAYPLLSEAGQVNLKAHKLFGTYLMFASVIVIIFKLLSVIVKRGLMKALYLLVLIVFAAGILKQGKEGGALVYQQGANVQRVQALDDELFDAKEALEELEASVKAKASAAVEAVKATTENATEAVKEKAAEVKKQVEEAVAPAETETTEAAPVQAAETEEAKVEEVKAEAPAAVEAPVTETPAVTETATEEAPAAPEVEVVPAAEPAQGEVATH